MNHINMLEVPGTSFEAKDPPGVAQFTQLLASKTAPVFEAETNDLQHPISEVVAVTYRDVEGKPVHGGLFGVSGQEVVSLTLKDRDGKVDTSEDPAHVAFGIVMMRGPLVFRQNGIDAKMDFSIIDMDAKKSNVPLKHPTPGKDAVKKAYLAEVLPNAPGYPDAWTTQALPDTQATVDARVAALPRLQQSAGAAYTLGLVASKALQEAFGLAKGVDWRKVHLDVFAKAVGQDRQPVAQVLEAIKLHSPGAVTLQQIAATEAMGESRKMLAYTQTNEGSTGRHLHFNVEITGENFELACQMAIDLAREESVAVSFDASAIPMRVESNDTVTTQFAIWKRWDAGWPRGASEHELHSPGAVTPQQIAAVDAMADPEEADLDDDESELSALDIRLRASGEQPQSTDQAMQWYEDGRRVFVFHEMDNQPTRADSLEIITNTTPDRILSLPADEKLDQLFAATAVRTSDGYTFNRQAGETWTDGDMTYPSLDHLYEACEGELLAVELQKNLPDWRVRRIAFVQEWSDPVVNRVLGHLQGSPDEVVMVLQQAVEDLNISALRGGFDVLEQRGSQALGFESFAELEQFKQAHPNLYTSHGAQPVLDGGSGNVVGVSYTEIVFETPAGPLCFDRARLDADVAIGDTIKVGRFGAAEVIKQAIVVAKQPSPQGSVGRVPVAVRPRSLDDSGPSGP